MKKAILLLSVILSIIFVTGCSENNDIVGNNDDEILQYLYKSDFMNTIGKDNITIVDTIYIDNSKVIGFLSNTGQGYLVYEKNKKGKYILTDNVAQGITQGDLGVSHFIGKYNLNNGLENSDNAYIVISNWDTVSKVEISINGRIFNKSLKTGKPSMILLKDMVPKSEYKDGVNFDCRYFDINNNELKNEWSWIFLNMYLVLVLN